MGRDLISMNGSWLSITDLDTACWIPISDKRRFQIYSDVRLGKWQRCICHSNSHTTRIRLDRTFFIKNTKKSSPNIFSFFFLKRVFRWPGYLHNLPSWDVASIRELRSSCYRFSSSDQILVIRIKESLFYIAARRLKCTDSIGYQRCINFDNSALRSTVTRTNLSTLLADLLLDFAR